MGISIAQEEPIKTAGIALKKKKKINEIFVYNNEIDTKRLLKSLFIGEKDKNFNWKIMLFPFINLFLIEIKNCKIWNFNENKR